MTAAFICTKLHMSGTKWPTKVLELVYYSAYIIFLPHVFLTVLDGCNSLFKMPLA